MGQFSTIEWCDHTFNPWMGCTKVSPACDHCYAEQRMDHRLKRVSWGPGAARVRTSDNNWKDPLKWDRAAAQDDNRPFVFCASLADVFDNEVDPAWRKDLFDLIEATPNLVWLLLTKRMGNVLKMTDPARGGHALPRNVAIGATMANQAEYDRDRLKLVAVSAQRSPLFTFASFEPLLGPVVLDRNAPDWIIVGGESGPNARRMDPAWPRSMRGQCLDLGRVFNFKQNGGRGADKGGAELDGQTYFDRPKISKVAQ